MREREGEVWRLKPCSCYTSTTPHQIWRCTQQHQYHAVFARLATMFRTCSFVFLDPQLYSDCQTLESPAKLGDASAMFEEADFEDRSRAKQMFSSLPYIKLTRLLKEICFR